MNLGFDDLRDLLERFLSNSGGRRGRDRERARRDAQAEAAGAGVGLGSEQGQDVAAGTGTGTETGAASSGAPTGDVESGTEKTTFERQERPDADDLEDDELVDDLYYRIENLEEELEDNGSQLGAIRDSQEHVSSQVEDVNDTIRQLLGVYDQVTNDVNPFTGDGEAEDGFGVFGSDASEPAEEGFGLHASETGSASDARASDETVSFADLKDMIEDAAEASSGQHDRDADSSSNGQKITFDEEAYIGGEDEDDTHVEVQATERVDADGSNEDGDGDESEDADDVTLHTLANTYATDLLVFEWLADLIGTAGPAATLRAISYYYEIGWIDADVKAHLEGVLGGPDLDIHVDPTMAPQELTAEDHADSYTYIMKLNEVHETRKEVET